MNYTLDVQWQPRNDLAFDFGYVGNLGRHQVIPVPFNQPNIASPSSPALAGGPFQQNYSYGYNVAGANLDDGTPYLYNYEGGNVDLRVPYIGYAAESIAYKAAGVYAYNALQVHVDKRMSHGLQVRGSYTYSHALDEQSGLGLFYNGNNPLNLRDGYASADFDRTHVFNFNYVYRLPDFMAEKHARGQGREWMVAGRADRSAERTALQRDRLLRRRRQHLLPTARRHHQSHRAAGHWLHAEERADTAPRAHGRRRGKPGPQSACFTLPLLPAGGLGGGDSRRRSL